MKNRPALWMRNSFCSKPPGTLSRYFSFFAQPQRHVQRAGRFFIVVVGCFLLSSNPEDGFDDVVKFGEFADGVCWIHMDIERNTIALSYILK